MWASTLLGMMARNTAADINVIALVGERAEVRSLSSGIWPSVGPLSGGSSHF